jgi:hypothetical protein
MQGVAQGLNSHDVHAPAPGPGVEYIGPPPPQDISIVYETQFLGTTLQNGTPVSRFALNYFKKDEFGDLTDDSTLVVVSSPTGGDMVPSAMNARAMVVGTDFTGNPTAQFPGGAFLYTLSGGIVELAAGPNNNANSQGNGLSDDGSVVVGGMFVPGLNPGDTVQHGFRWTSSLGMADLGVLPGAVGNTPFVAP